MAKKKISPEARVALEGIRRDIRELIVFLQAKLDATQRS
jgi:hypothetical protein